MSNSRAKGLNYADNKSMDNHVTSITNLKDSQRHQPFTAEAQIALFKDPVRTAL